MTGQEPTNFFVDYWRDIVSVLGFALTIWALVTARSAKEVARKAREAAQRSIAKSDTISTLTLTVFSIERVCELQEQQSWDGVPALYRNIRQSLAKVMGEGSPLSKGDQAYIQNAIVELTQIAEYVDEYRSAQIVTIEGVPKLNGTVYKYALEFIRMNQELQRNQE